jgi:hypothetical protein
LETIVDEEIIPEIELEVLDEEPEESEIVAEDNQQIGEELVGEEILPQNFEND